MKDHDPLSYENVMRLANHVAESDAMRDLLRSSFERESDAASERREIRAALSKLSNQEWVTTYQAQLDSLKREMRDELSDTHRELLGYMSTLVRDELSKLYTPLQVQLESLRREVRDSFVALSGTVKDASETCDELSDFINDERAAIATDLHDLRGAMAADHRELLSYMRDELSTLGRTIGQDLERIENVELQARTIGQRIENVELEAGTIGQDLERIENGNQDADLALDHVRDLEYEVRALRNGGVAQVGTLPGSSFDLHEALRRGDQCTVALLGLVLLMITSLVACRRRRKRFVPLVPAPV